MFHIIDLDKWNRTEYYNHFLNVVPCSYNITANVDITGLLADLKRKSFKLYPALIFILTKVVNDNSEFRMAHDENRRLGYFDECHPSYTIPNAIPDGFSGIWGMRTERFSEFHAAYRKDVETYSASKRYAPKADQPYNTFYVSCTPELSFTALSLHLYEGRDLLTPMFTIGKYFVSEGKTLLPVSACLHHAVCDGTHAAKLYKQLQSLSDCTDWIE